MIILLTIIIYIIGTFVAYIINRKGMSMDEDNPFLILFTLFSWALPISLIVGVILYIISEGIGWLYKSLYKKLFKKL